MMRQSRWPLVTCLAVAFAAVVPLAPALAGDAEIAPVGAGGTAHVPFNLVKAAQRFLADNDYSPGPADGIAGPMTEAAVMAWQRDHALDANGALDAATLASMGLGAQ